MKTNRVKLARCHLYDKPVSCTVSLSWVSIPWSKKCHCDFIENAMDEEVSLRFHWKCFSEKSWPKLESILRLKLQLKLNVVRNVRSHCRCQRNEQKVIEQLWFWRGFSDKKANFPFLCSWAIPQFLLPTLDSGMATNASAYVSVQEQREWRIHSWMKKCHCDFVESKKKWFGPCLCFVYYDKSNGGKKIFISSSE